MTTGDPITVIERTYTGEVFEWEGRVTRVEKDYFETQHRRNRLTHPQWRKFDRAYELTTTRHFSKANVRCKAKEHPLK